MATQAVPAPQASTPPSQWSSRYRGVSWEPKFTQKTDLQLTD